MTGPFPRLARVGVAGLAGLALAVGVSGCSADPNSAAEQAKSGDNKGFISGSGTFEQIPAGDRAEPVKLAGETLDGGSWDVADHRGDVVVVNVWASWCGPCVAEAPELRAVHEATKEDDVEFVGIDSREPPENGLAQQKAWGHTYPSLTDESGTLVLALQGKAAATPTTAVLDREGRIAAVVLGAVTESTLTGLVEDTLAEGA
ncbi:TlpA family protein disulfide reductase [Janibacter sp. G1551]|uniref:TlpA family protein disulfide reductase n=1 Tax=Janibacter sp. G1551 TaxID=3420440 RepID=UPI003D00F05A